MREIRPPFFFFIIMGNTQKLLEAFIEQPTTYTIDVLDNTMLPEGIKDKKQLKFTIRRPTLKVLASMALPLSKIPKEIQFKENLELSEAAPYLRDMVKSIAVAMHGARGNSMPDWYEDFLFANLTDMELFLIFKEASIKSNSSFFLSYIHSASQTNPMMIENSTPTS